jgi:hypothetical protein
MMIAGFAPISTSTLVKTGPGAVIGVVLTAAAADAALTLQDGLTATGTVLCTLAAAQKTSSAFTPLAAWPFSTGCYATISGASATATVIYQ